jgi:phage-related protein
MCSTAKACICSSFNSSLLATAQRSKLGLVQAGLDPEDWKPMESVGAGVKEIKSRNTK